MIKKYFSSGLVALGLLAVPAFGNNFVVLPTGDFSCEVEVAPHDAPDPKKAASSDKAGLEVTKIVITKIGQLRRDITHWRDGTTTELWNLTDKGVALLVGKQKGDHNVTLLRGEYRKAASPQLLNFDEASVAWISENSLQKDGKAAQGDNHYSSQVTLKEADGSEPPEVALYQAWIDPKTLMPKKLDDGYSSYTLRFSKAVPAEGLVLPPQVKAELDLWIKASAGHKHR